LGLDHQAVSALYTLQGLGALCGALLIAPWADRYGRRNTLALVIAGFGLAALCTSVVHSYSVLLLQRFGMGFFLGGVFGCTVSLYVGLFRPEECGVLAGLVQLVYNGGDATLSWFGRLTAEGDWRQVVVSGGVAALVAAALLLALVPDDRTLARAVQTGSPPPHGASVRELFRAGRASLTLRLALLCGLNFFAFQSFNGWLSTYLREVLHLSANAVGGMVTAVHLGSMTGAILWGLAADWYGRRFNAYAFYAAGALIAIYLVVPALPTLLAVIGFAYGFAFVASGVWGPYFTELYPSHLRATAASIFNWGRAVSLVGALGSGWIAEHVGLQAAMGVGAVVFAGAAALWRTLPETLPSPAERRHSTA
jgi:MFS family permease